MEHIPSAGNAAQLAQPVFMQIPIPICVQAHALMEGMVTRPLISVLLNVLLAITWIVQACV